ncbi:MAG: von Willebrand factor type A domain-containing protein, partial [Planctomycetes bacterium]|nr:von Willebrand factor type A domain-containing protein [Planctomycetota bacterium]
MSHSNPQHDRWLNERLRDVQMPEGLLLRLRQIARGDEQQLDRALCEVALPEGFLARLKEIPAASAVQFDEQLDRRLRDVPVPAGLVGRLKGIAIATDEDLDEAVRDVPVPEELIVELKKMVPVHRWTQPRRRIHRVAEMALAASLLLMIGGSYLGAMASLIVDTLGGNRRAVVSLETPRWEVEIPSVEAEFELSADRPALEPPRQLIGPVEFRMELARQFDQIVPPGTISDPFALPSGFSPEDFETNFMLHRWGGLVFAYDREWDALGAIRTLPAIVPRGSEPPEIGQFDWRFYLQHQVFPFVSPAAESSLRTSAVPLGADTHSYDLAQRRLADGKLPEAEDVRVEDFLAAIDYHFLPPRRDALGIRTAAGPSPLSANMGAHLLQVGVQAAEMPAGARQGTHLTVALDVSASMGWQGRWDMTQEALRGLIGRLGPHDRLSIVVFSDKAERLIENLSAEDADLILAAVGALQPNRSTNVGAGLASACWLAMQGSPGGDFSRRVVLLTDGLPRLSDSASARIEQIVSDARVDGITLEVIDLSGDLQTDERLKRLAAGGGGTVHPAT